MDIEMTDIGDGGELVKYKNDFSIVEGFENMPYLCLFGGNLQQSTPSVRPDNQEAFDFWGNALLMPNTPDAQFNSQTEKMLNSVALTSSGLILIENAVKADLKPMEEFCIVKVIVSLVTDDRLLIAIQLTKKDNLQQKEFVYIWDTTLAELDAKAHFTVTNNTVSVKIFDYTFDFSFE